MRKIILSLIFLLMICTIFLSGCTSSPDWNDPFGFESSATICGIVIIIVVILVVILLIGLARSGTKKDITIHTPPSHYSPPTVIVQQEPKDTSRKDISKPERRCPECGHVIPDDAKLCPYCGKKFKTHYKEEQDEEKTINKKSEDEREQKTISKRPKYCPECGQKLEDDLVFCTNCGTKL